MERTFVIVQWPEIQELMDKPGFKENCCLVNDESFVEEYGSSAYFVDKEWLTREIKYDESLNPICPHCGKNVDSYVKDPNSPYELRDLEKVVDGEYGVQIRCKYVWHCPYCNQEFYQICEH